MRYSAFGTVGGFRRVRLGCMTSHAGCRAAIFWGGVARVSGPVKGQQSGRIVMAARTTRAGARARIRTAFEKALDQVIPADEWLPLRGGTFIEWEDQADAFDQ